MFDSLIPVLPRRATDKGRARLIAVRAMLFCCLFLATPASAANLPCELRVSKPEWGAYAVCAVDANGDSADELYITEAYGEKLEDGLESFAWYRGAQFPLGADCYAWAADLAGNGKSDVVVTAGINDSIWVYVIDNARAGARRRFLVDGGPPRSGRPLEQGSPRAAFVDLNGDSAVDLVIAIACGYEWRSHPRGVVAIDGRTGKRLWWFGMGPNVSAFLADDVDEDGKPEVLISTNSPSNGCSENGTDDASTYVVCLDNQGRKRWIRPFRTGSGGSTSIALTRAPNTNQPLLVVREECSYDSTPPDSLVILDAGTGIRLRSTVADQIHGSVFAVDLNADGQDEIVSGEGRSVVIRDLDLNEISRRVLDNGPIRLALCGHLLGRKTSEFAVTVANARLVMLDDHLRTLAQHAFDGKHLDWNYLRLRRRGPSRPTAIIVGFPGSWEFGDPRAKAGDAYLELQLVVLPRPFPWIWVSAGLGVLLLGAVGLVFGLRRGYREQVDTLTRGLAGKAGVVRLGWRGEVVAINDNARTVLGLPAVARPGTAESLLAQPELLPLRDAVARVAGGRDKQVTCQFIVGQGDKKQTYLARVSRLGFRNVLVGIENQSAAEYARRVLEWAPVAQKLAHDIKNPLTAMSLALQRVEKSRGQESGRYVESMKEDIDRLKKMTDGFMRLTKLEPPSLQPANLNELARECLARFEDATPPGIHIVRELAEGLPAVALDRQQFTVACANVVENAIAAMTERGGTLRVVTKTEGDSVVFVVSDTGKGIPERYLAKVFEPYFTMKPGGTGLGMYLTKRIIEEHKGTIAIESKEGEGTTVTITLRALDGNA